MIFHYYPQIFFTPIFQIKIYEKNSLTPENYYHKFIHLPSSPPLPFYIIFLKSSGFWKLPIAVHADVFKIRNVVGVPLKNVWLIFGMTSQKTPFWVFIRSSIVFKKPLFLMNSFKFFPILRLISADDRYSNHHPVEKMNDLLNQVDWIRLFSLDIFCREILSPIFYT